MKLKTIVWLLSLLVIVAMTGGIYAYYKVTLNTAYTEDTILSGAHIREIKNNVSQRIRDYTRVVKILSGLKAMSRGLENPSEQTLKIANEVLDLFNASMGTDVAYLLNDKGLVVAATNRNQKDSFLGKNYAFRDYFNDAAKGLPAVFWGLGVTSGKRGIYFSHPVYADSTVNPVGVVVIKENVDKVDRFLLQQHYPSHDLHKHVSLIANDLGVVFISDTEKYLYKALWKLSEKEKTLLKGFRQFGDGSFEWLGFIKIDGRRIFDAQGNLHQIESAAIEAMPGWRIFHLTDMTAISKSVSAIVFKRAGSVGAITAGIMALILIVMNRLAIYEIARRKEAEDRFREVFTHMGSGVAIYQAVNDGSDFIFKEINPSASRIGKLPSHDHIGKNFTDVYPGVKKVGLLDCFQRVWRTGKPEYFPVARYEDERISLWMENYVCKLPTGEIVSVYDDISNRKKMEQKLKKSEEVYRSMMDAMKDLVYICSQDFTIEYLNPAMVEHLGSNAVGDTCYRAIYGFDKKCSWCVLEQVMKGETIEHDVERLKDGRTFHVASTPVLNPDGSISKMAIYRDVTLLQNAIKEKDAAEKMLVQAQKMESIGTLAGGIAHDFNNILSSVIGFTELSLEDAEKGSILEDNLQEIFKAGKRARDLVRQILTFARQSDEVNKPVEARAIGMEALKLIRASIPATIEIRQRFESNSLIMGSPTQVHQIFMNLCTNATHAMEDTGGVLEVGMADETLNEDFVKPYEDLKPGNYIRIWVSDTGTGIPPENMDLIFEPYFTTKGTGEGTGMGLAMIHGIVKAWQGEIVAESRPGKGSCFTLYLPVVRKRSEHPLHESESPTGGTERILLVDDEAAIAKMGGQILEGLGYDVTTRTSSIEALELFNSKPHAFDLVITDMTMPNMTGDKLAEKLTGIRADVPIILCTGYSKKLSDEPGAIPGVRAFAFKPIVKVALAETIRQVLDRQSG